MEVSPKTFREVEFREKLRGYHPEDVDQFLEQMATGVEALHEKLRQALERAQRAEALAAESGGSDETLRRTLVLAQRTADQAVQEAREQASRIVGAAEQKAQAMLAEAEERARRLHNEALADVRSELAKLETTRAHSQQEVDRLERWADEQRAHLVASLHDALGMLERGGLTSPPPSSTPLDVPRGPASRPASSASATAPAPGGHYSAVEPPAPEAEPARAAGSEEPPGSGPRRGHPGDEVSATLLPPPPELDRDQTVVQAPPPSPRADQATDVTEVALSSGGRVPTVAPPPTGRVDLDLAAEGEVDEDAMDSFFHGEDYSDDDRRFGGRLRRRR
jgi:cell division initiation protein